LVSLRETIKQSLIAGLDFTMDANDSNVAASTGTQPMGNRLKKLSNYKVSIFLNNGKLVLP